MLAQSTTRASGASGRRQLFPSWTGLLLVQGCTATPSAPMTERNPSDPAARSAPAAYRSVIGPYASQRPTDPAAWQERNGRVAPQSSD